MTLQGFVSGRVGSRPCHIPVALSGQGPKLHRASIFLSVKWAEHSIRVRVRERGFRETRQGPGPAQRTSGPVSRSCAREVPTNDGDPAPTAGVPAPLLPQSPSGFFLLPSSLRGSEGLARRTERDAGRHPRSAAWTDSSRTAADDTVNLESAGLGPRKVQASAASLHAQRNPAGTGRPQGKGLLKHWACGCPLCPAEGSGRWFSQFPGPPAWLINQKSRLITLRVYKRKFALPPLLPRD